MNREVELLVIQSERLIRTSYLLRLQAQAMSGHLAALLAECDEICQSLEAECGTTEALVGRGEVLVPSLAG